MDSAQLSNNIQNTVKVGWHDDFMSATFQPNSTPFKRIHNYIKNI